MSKGRSGAWKPDVMGVEAASSFLSSFSRHFCRTVEYSQCTLVDVFSQVVDVSL